MCVCGCVDRWVCARAYVRANIHECTKVFHAYITISVFVYVLHNLCVCLNLCGVGWGRGSGQVDRRKRETSFLPCLRWMSYFLAVTFMTRASPAFKQLCAEEERKQRSDRPAVPCMQCTQRRKPHNKKYLYLEMIVENFLFLESWKRVLKKSSGQTPALVIGKGMVLSARR